jgi:uncharacterized cofD-like protein
VLQHRFAGHGEMNGHVIGNLLIVGLWEQLGDPVAALDWVGRLLGTAGRVLPMALTPLDITAEVRGTDPADPARATTVRGQVQVATVEGVIDSIALDPPDPEPCPQAVEAVRAADWLVLGPGSWFTSVLPHLLVPRLRAALAATPARVVVVLNLEPQPGETEGFSPEEHLQVLQAHLGGVALHTVIADADAVVDRHGLLVAARRCGAELVLAPVADPGGAPRHDPVRLSAALAAVAGAR